MPYYIIIIIKVSILKISVYCFLLSIVFKNLNSFTEALVTSPEKMNGGEAGCWRFCP